MAFLAIKSVWQNKGKGFPSMASQAVTGSAAINSKILFRPSCTILDLYTNGSAID